MVTAEFAVAIPAVVLVLALCLFGVSAGIDQVRCVDAARAGARALARGDDPGRVQRLVATAAPRGAAIAMSTTGDEVLVSVVVVRSLLGGPASGGAPLGGVTLRATATAQREQAGG